MPPAAPTPIPAFAASDRPVDVALLDEGGFAGPAAVAEDGEAVKVPDGRTEEVSAALNVPAMTTGFVSQQLVSFGPPQHHFSLVEVPSHGVSSLFCGFVSISFHRHLLLSRRHLA